jgi:rhodanese-related sulfurtransferase
METLSLHRPVNVDFFQLRLTHEIGPRSLSRLLNSGDEVQVVDVRGPEAYLQGHVPGALNLPFEPPHGGDYLYHLNKTIPVVVYSYDEDCTIDLEAAYLLSRNGYQVKVLLGGWQGWLRANPCAESPTAA